MPILGPSLLLEAAGLHRGGQTAGPQFNSNLEEVRKTTKTTINMFLDGASVVREEVPEQTLQNGFSAALPEDLPAGGA